eukprot:Skav228123  [mRNA]  locus=scaffold1220:233952:234455:+ [translate_table: standard]
MDAAVEVLQGEEALKKLPEILAVQKEVFRGEGRAPETWKQRLAEGQGLHLVIRGPDGRIASFLTAYQSKKIDRTKATAESDCLHLWMAGTLPEHRGKRMMSAIFQKALEIAAERGLQYVTLNTFPEEFCEMFKLATGRWGMSEDTGCPLVQGKVALFKTLPSTREGS